MHGENVFYVGDDSQDFRGRSQSEKLLAQVINLAERIEMPGFFLGSGKVAGMVYLEVTRWNKDGKGDIHSRKRFLGVPPLDDFSIVKAYLELTMECLGAWVGQAFQFDNQSIFNLSTTCLLDTSTSD
jgi:hypothetical protein